ncbi:MAG TPA: hypothetical protein VF658_13570 [Pyrinomonadaceae bacterium]|jgi:hypothetical protein
MAEEQDDQVMGDPPQGGTELQAQTGSGPGDPPPFAPDDGGYTDPDAPIQPGDPPPSDSDTETTTDSETTSDSETTPDDPTASAILNTGEGDPPPH